MEGKTKILIDKKNRKKVSRETIMNDLVFYDKTQKRMNGRINSM